MSFRIWACGLRGKNSKGHARSLFHYSKDNCLDQGDFEPNSILSAIPSSPDASGIAEKIVGGPESHIGGAEVKGMMKIAEMEFAHLVITGVNLLAMHGSNGSISLYCYEKKWYWADSNSFVNVQLWGSDPGREFLRRIGPGLKKTGLNNFGVLAQIAMCLSAYERKLPDSADANLRIEIRH